MNKEIVMLVKKKQDGKIKERVRSTPSHQLLPRKVTTSYANPHSGTSSVFHRLHIIIDTTMESEPWVIYPVKLTYFHWKIGSSGPGSSISISLSGPISIDNKQNIINAFRNV